MKSAPRLATMLSLLRLSWNGFSKLAEVKPYTELMAVLRALAKALAISGSSRYFASFPPSIVFALSNSLCFMARRASLISLNLAVYSGPKRSSAMILDGCILATSSRATLKYMPGSEYTYPPSPITSPRYVDSPFSYLYPGNIGRFFPSNTVNSSPKSV